MDAMSHGQFKKLLKSIGDVDDLKFLLRIAISKTLWRMREICYEQGLMCKPTKKLNKSLSRNSFDFLEDFIYFDRDDGQYYIRIRDLDPAYGETILDGISIYCFPVSWLWRKNWEIDEFIKIWILEK